MTIGDEAGSRNLEQQLKELIGDRVLVLDHKFSYGELFETLTCQQVKAGLETPGDGELPGCALPGQGWG